MEYLDFELPIKEINDQLEKCKLIGDESDIDISDTYKKLEIKLVETKKKVYSNLTSWQRVQLSRHPSRPYTLDYINGICGNTFLELHGDRNFKDDKGMIGGLGKKVIIPIQENTEILECQTLTVIERHLG